MKQNRCIAKNRYGKPCGGFAMSGVDFCFSHDPNSLEKLKLARRKGGRNRRSAKGISNYPGKINNFEDILKWINSILQDTWQLENSATRSRTIGYLLSIAQKIIFDIDLANRLDLLENAIRLIEDKKYVQENNSYPRQTSQNWNGHNL